MVVRQDASTGKMVEVGELPSPEAGTTAPNGQLTMHVKVYSPYQTYFDQQALSVSGENATGPFDILPRHHKFITLLTPCELVIRKVEGGAERIRIDHGVMHVKSDKVVVFLDV